MFIRKSNFARITVFGSGFIVEQRQAIFGIFQIWRQVGNIEFSSRDHAAMFAHEYGFVPENIGPGRYGF